ncbi:hypothetical protein CYMTET_48759 [Cymbomonas tetramitiformis]|uniref:Uncharacterized protein n=1 Tax=Cymbomonas tetramitiformis TaxID=36881 RepID=A0AAE0EV83_9CHLO|nr:hypothetical protein CYMTET_48759 [Cymbomonas tetramitiformis]
MLVEPHEKQERDHLGAEDVEGVRGPTPRTKTRYGKLAAWPPAPFPQPPANATQKSDSSSSRRSYSHVDTATTHAKEEEQGGVVKVTEAETQDPLVLGEQSKPQSVIIEEQAELILELRDRVRQLAAELNREKEKREETQQQAQYKVKKLQAEKEKYFRKMQNEKEAATVAVEETRTKEEVLEKMREENTRLRENLGKVDEVSKKGWHYVALQNKRLQKIRHRQADLQRNFQRQTKARIKAQEQRDRMELQVNPLQQRNLEMGYRLQLQAEWHSDTLQQLTAVEEQLLGDRTVLNRINRQLATTAKQKADAVEESTHTQLMVNELYEDNTELQRRFDTLYADNQQCNKTLKRLKHEVQESQSRAAQVKLELGSEVTWRQSIEEELGAKDEELQALVDDVAHTKQQLQAEEAARISAEEKLQLAADELKLMKAQFPEVKHVTYTAKARSTMQLVRVQQNPKFLQKVLKGPSMVSLNATNATAAALLSPRLPSLCGDVAERENHPNCNVEAKMYNGSQTVR